MYDGTLSAHTLYRMFSCSRTVGYENICLFWSCSPNFLVDLLEFVLISKSSMSSYDILLELISRFIYDFYDISVSLIVSSPLRLCFWWTNFPDLWEAISTFASLSIYPNYPPILHLIDCIDLIDFKDFKLCKECSDIRSSPWEAFTKNEETTDDILWDNLSFFCYRHFLKILWIFDRLSDFCPTFFCIFFVIFWSTIALFFS